MGHRAKDRTKTVIYRLQQARQSKAQCWSTARAPTTKSTIQTHQSIEKANLKLPRFSIFIESGCVAYSRDATHPPPCDPYSCATTRSPSSNSAWEHFPHSCCVDTGNVWYSSSSDEGANSPWPSTAAGPAGAASESPPPASDTRCPCRFGEGITGTNDTPTFIAPVAHTYPQSWTPNPWTRTRALLGLARALLLLALVVVGRGLANLPASEHSPKHPSNRPPRSPPPRTCLCSFRTARPTAAC